jgi:hypothetical protein
MPEPVPHVKPAAQANPGRRPGKPRPILSPEIENPKLARARKTHHPVPVMPCHPPALELATIGTTHRKGRSYAPFPHATRQPYSRKEFSENWHMTYLNNTFHT